MCLFVTTLCLQAGPGQPPDVFLQLEGYCLSDSNVYCSSSYEGTKDEEEEEGGEDQGGTAAGGGQEGD